MAKRQRNKEIKRQREREGKWLKKTYLLASRKILIHFYNQLIKQLKVFKNLKKKTVSEEERKKWKRM